MRNSYNELLYEESIIRSTYYWKLSLNEDINYLKYEFNQK